MSSVSYSVAEQAAPLSAVSSLLGASPAMQEVFRLIERVGSLPTALNEQHSSRRRAIVAS